MKTKLMILSITLISLAVWTMQAKGQEDPYTSAMKSAIELMEQASEPGELAESANRFERIATAEKSKWMPYYLPPSPLFP